MHSGGMLRQMANFLAAIKIAHPETYKQSQNDDYYFHTQSWLVAERKNMKVLFKNTS
jgi:hypothetical protein